MDSKRVFFTVGPAELYPTVPGYVREALATNVLSTSHRSAAFTDWYRRAVSGIRTLLGAPEAFHVFFLGSATEAMERAIENCVERKSAHVVYGAFSKRWHKMAESLGKETENLTVPDGEIPNLAEAVFSPDVEFIALTHNETSTGGMLQFADIVKLHARYPDALIGVDIVSSTPTVSVPWDAVDIVLLSVQKGMGLPAGLGVMFVSPRAYAKAETLSKKMSIGSYHNFLELKHYADKDATHETPNVFDIYLLAHVAEDMLKVGVDTLRANIERRAKMVYDFLENSPFAPAIVDPAHRSLTTISAKTPAGSAAVIERGKEQNIIMAGGYGNKKDSCIRIGNFPAHTDEDFERLLAVLKSF
ncbi:MAG: alanine--glyoxylate aminotransferase family protein [Patescibacteria group bacterium]|nr:alanine--glyoxylate aminotransferase family protein [Patescibacteria group bacterium]